MNQKAQMAETQQNPMRTIHVSKVTLNIGAGISGDSLEKGMKLLQKFTGIKPSERVTTKRIPTWNVRPGLKIGAMVTVRRKKAVEILVQLLKAKENKLQASQFDNLGNVAFGIHEYIDISELKYDAEIGIIGFEAAVTLERPGYRIKRRRLRQRKISSRHQITKQEAINFMESTFNIEVQGK